MLLLLLVLVLIGFTTTSSSDPLPLTPILESVPLLGVTTPVKLSLPRLLPLSTYEILVSFPASTPCTPTLHFVDPVSHSTRGLLNTEKLVFATDEQGKPPSEVVLVDALPEGIELEGSEGGVRRAGFRVNIILERLVAGAIPWGTVSVGLYAVVAVLLVLAVVVPRLKSSINAKAPPARTTRSTSRRA
jgi:hypothetical protein